MTELVGILNVTPDSFSDGGDFIEPAAALAQAARLFSEGASLVDVGAESTRPHATPLTPGQEWQRLELILPELLRRYPGKIALDSYHPETIERAYKLGPVIINDVTGMNNPDMVALAAKLQATCIVSHLPGADIQVAHQEVPVTSVEQVRRDLLERASELIAQGVPKEHIILDPGIGFGKAPEVNMQLLRFAELVPDYLVMIGYSRKRFLGEGRMELPANLEAGRTAIAAGARYLRVHDVAGHYPLVQGE